MYRSLSMEVFRVGFLEELFGALSTRPGKMSELVNVQSNAHSSSMLRKLVGGDSQVVHHVLKVVGDTDVANVVHEDGERHIE